MLDVNYSAEFTMVDLLYNIHALLAEPEHDSPIDTVLGELWKTDHAVYFARAKASVASLSSVSFSDACSLLADERAPGCAPAAVPDTLRCPITKALFVEPMRSVTTGVVYERQALVDGWAKGGGQIVCPVSGEVVTPQDVVLDEELKAEAEKQRTCYAGKD
jgi:hypothetical protein